MHEHWEKTVSICLCLPSASSVSFLFFPHAAKLIDALAIERSVHRLCILVFTAVNDTSVQRQGKEKKTHEVVAQLLSNGF